MVDLKKILAAHREWLRTGEGERADLYEADLRGADLRGADLRGADLRGADLSGANGILSAASWIEDNFDFSADGVIVYKRIGETQYAQPKGWEIKEGAEISEVCNPCRVSGCACGVNFGTREWCEKNYTKADLWECQIRWKDLAGVVVPYNTDGKARCERLVLVRNLSKEPRPCE